MEKGYKSNGLTFWEVLATLGFLIGQKLVSAYEKKKNPPENVVRRIYVKGSEPVHVKANSLPYHIERGWRKNAKGYEGYYRSRFGAFRGEIEQRGNGDYKFYIVNPPIEVLTGPHKPCFTDNGYNRFHIHFAIDAKNNVDSGVMAVERLLTESFKRR